jgi:hypothetical protein
VFDLEEELIQTNPKMKMYKNSVLLFTCLVSSFILLNVNDAISQDTKKLTKKERREVQEKERENNLQKTLNLVNQLNFVLKTDYLIDKQGSQVTVDSKINFILIDTTNAVIQIGSGYDIGDNGVGGITAEGKMTDWKIKVNNRQKSIYLSFNLSTLKYRFNVVILIDSDGKSKAYLSSMKKGTSISFIGNIVPLRGSGIYKGSAYY